METNEELHQTIKNVRLAAQKIADNCRIRFITYADDLLKFKKWEVFKLETPCPPDCPGWTHCETYFEADEVLKFKKEEALLQLRTALLTPPSDEEKSKC